MIVIDVLGNVLYATPDGSCIGYLVKNSSLERAIIIIDVCRCYNDVMR